jgi:predicted nucleotide-binding protein
MESLVGFIKDFGYDVLNAENPDAAFSIIKKYKNNIDLVIVDLQMPYGSTLSALESKGGFVTGLALARKILLANPKQKIFAFSVVSDPVTMNWFLDNTVGYLIKPSRITEIIRMINKAIGGEEISKLVGPKIFIVHGHDETTLLSLKNYLQNKLKLPEPIILREQPSNGKTVIEKFESYTEEVDIVFILLTPDDEVKAKDAMTTIKSRARQNVILELGYFYGKLHRHSGKVILLYKGELEIPSDISGIIYIDISDGIDAAGEKIRTELKSYLK